MCYPPWLWRSRVASMYNNASAPKFLQCSIPFIDCILNCIGIRWLSEAEARLRRVGDKLLHLAKRPLGLFLVDSTVASQITVALIEI
jgi:hypothetical protein